MAKKQKKKEGRPPVVDEITLQKLEEAFSNGATDLEACFIAKISKSTLYNYQEEHPDFLERKQALKDLIKYQARKNIKEKVFDGDVETSKWYAERKMKDEFSQKIENEHSMKGLSKILDEIESNG